MLSRRQRIPSADLRQAQKAIISRSPSFVITGRKNGLPEARFAIVVGVKVDRRSVRRHLLKRRASGVLEKTELKGQDIVLLILPPANILSAKAFRENLAAMLNPKS